MKKLLALVLCLCMMIAAVPAASADEEPITLSVLSYRHEEAPNDITDLWIFKYLEYWLAEQGYNVKFELEQTFAEKERISLMLATGSLPDLIWGLTLGNENIVLYGAGEHMLLDWTPYLNEETMPNLMAQFAIEPDAYTASICNDGKIYGLPWLSARTYPDASATSPNAMRMWIYKDWLEQVNMEVPNTMEGFLDMLRAFKTQIKLEDGKEVIPLMENAQFLRKYLMACLGFYGIGTASYDGITPMINNGKVVVTAYTEQYRTYLELLNTMYTEGLISPDYFTMDTTTAQGYMSDGVCGVVGDWTLSKQVEDRTQWVGALPAATKHCANPVSSLSFTYKPNTVLASAETKHPELLAKICDYLYSEEGSMLYTYGPMKGQDPLGLVEGWHIDENGQLVVPSTDYAKTYIFPAQYAGYCDHLALPAAYKAAGVEPDILYHDVVDAVTGKVLKTRQIKQYEDGHWMMTITNAWKNNSTAVYLPTVYMSEEDAITAADLKSVLQKHIESETAKFVVGNRPLSEFDQFQKELESMGVEEYLNLYTEAYSGYMASVFGE